ncbi:MAG: phage tail assembly protein [Rickettsiales bacterium]|nr:phage tail assembly protein [Rickettsiales bacterium]
MTDKILKTFKLKFPIMIAGEKKTTLDIREPSTRDVREIGLPFNIGASGVVDMDMKKLGTYIEKLSDLMNCEDLEIADFTAIAMEIMSFLGVQMGEIAPAA